jgi:hypothetical protein
MEQFEVVKFSQIKDRLPDDCWARRRYDSQGEFSDEIILYCPGDAILPFLDLDTPHVSLDASEAPDPHVFMVLVEGDLTVESWIGNDDTDGASGLIVKGNLKAKNVILGGQQVYVTGNMHVEEILWGDYNHGDLIVGGETSAALFIATEQYGFDLRGGRGFRRQLIDEGPGGGDWDLMDSETLSKVIEPDCVMDEPDYGHVVLMRGEILRRLKAGQPVLRKEGLEEKVPTVPSIFDDRNVTIDNILKIADPGRMPADLEGRSAPRFEFWADDTLCRATAFGKEDEFDARRLIYLQDTSHALLFTVSLEEEPRSFWQKIWRRPPAGVWRMGFKGRRFHEEGDEEWLVIEPEPHAEGLRAFPEEFHPLLAKGWNTLLDAVSIYDHARTLINPDEVRRLLSLAVVEPYDNFYDERFGFWAGHVCCGFRQDGALWEGKAQPALLRVAREYTHTDGRDLIELYFFEIRRHFDGTECVFISYKDDEDSEEPRVPISFLGGRHLELARRAFNTARRNLDKADRDLLERGMPPDMDDAFAIKDWRKKGYIK